ncbi:MAG: FeoA family protein [Bergeyella zoohelcum]|nr:FeoA family protein [Bergeyella zoohelcum]
MKINSKQLNDFPLNTLGKIVDYDNQDLQMPSKIIEMGLLPNTEFRILHQAPFGGPLYIEFGKEKSKIALRTEEAKYIIVQSID